MRAGGPYERRSIFESLDKAWEMLRTFNKEELSKIPDKILDGFYARKAEMDAVDGGGEGNLIDA